MRGRRRPSRIVPGGERHHTLALVTGIRRLFARKARPLDKQQELEAEAAEAVNHYAGRGHTRRDLVKRIGFGVLAAPVVGSVLAACTSDEDPEAVANEAAS